MQLKPLRNQVLVQLLPLEENSPGGIFLPDTARQAGVFDKAWPRKGKVLAIGAWRKTKDGLSILPDFQPGDAVLVNEYLGTKLTRNIGENYRLCKVDDVLAVLEGNGDIRLH